MVSPKRLPSHSRDNFPLLLTHLRRLVHPRRSPSSRGTEDEQCGTISHAIGKSGSSLSLPPGLDLSSVANPDTPPEHLVIAVWNLPPFLPIGYEIFGEGDLDVVGSHRIGVGGFADVWMGKMNNGATVVIKSYRRYSSSSCSSVYMVSVKHYRVLYPLTAAQSGCTMKH